MNKKLEEKKRTPLKSLFHKHDREVEVIKTLFDKIIIIITLPIIVWTTY